MIAESALHCRIEMSSIVRWKTDDDVVTCSHFPDVSPLKVGLRAAHSPSTPYDLQAERKGQS
jgi:hypothetical protein